MRHRLRSPITGQVYSAGSIDLARELRRDQTPAERRVWGWLRGRRMLGLRFRRQQPIAGLIVDFYCPSLRMAIELDGAVHDTTKQLQWDAERDASLERRGIRVVRVRNEEATRRGLESRLRSALPPLPQGEGPGVRVQTAERGRG